MNDFENKPLARRVFPIIIFVVLLFTVPGASAQHLAGSGFSGGHVRGFSGGGFHGGFSTPRSFSGFSGQSPRSLGSAPRMTWTAPRYNVAPLRGAYSNYRQSFSVADRRGRYRRPYLGYGNGDYPYLYANSWGLLPWDLGYPDFTGYGEDSGGAESNNLQVQSTDEELPPPDEQGYLPAYPRGPYEAPAAQTAASMPPRDEPKLTLIFKDGHTLAIRNYVLTPTDVIIMDDAASGREPRIAVADLNLQATEQAAQQDGLEFSPPSYSQTGLQ
ncbi:MAG: hypothetical protein WA634_09725 [Silvibacterium sp.]